jgi:tellurite resistance protein
MENRDAVEATVWGAYSIAYADGTCDAKEIAVLEKTISALRHSRHLLVKLPR